MAGDAASRLSESTLYGEAAEAAAAEGAAANGADSGALASSTFHTGRGGTSAQFAHAICIKVLPVSSLPPTLLSVYSCG